MFKGGRVLGIIPARGGSKRLPKKNILFLGNKPLIAWSIQAAKNAGQIDKVVVSTEDSEIEKISFEWGISDVIKRSQSLAVERATTNAVVIEVLQKLKEQGESYDYIILLQPTSPLRTVADIEYAFDLIEKENAAGAVSVCKTEHPVEWMGKIEKDGFMDSFIRESGVEKNSHDLTESYQINGALYIARVDRFLDEKTLFLRSGIIAYVMDRASSVDIDDNYDFNLAAWLLSRR